MLVNSRLKACGICHKRKVKCDKTKPKCLSCIRDGWECPGYRTVWKEKPRSRTSRVYPQYESQWILDPIEEDASKLLRNTQDLKSFRVFMNEADKQHVIPPPCGLPSSFSFLLAQKLVRLLEEDVGFGVKIGSLGLFMLYIPARLGHNKALDDATECICSTYISLLQADSDSNKSDRKKYLQALRSLRHCITDDGRAFSSNVLAAAVLLSWYEILAENLDNSWLLHIRGCAKLIQARGPLRHVATFDRALLMAESGHISAEALISCSSSFLDSPIWQAALERHQDMAYEKDWYLQSLDPINSRLAQVSTILSDLNNLKNSIRQKSYDMTQIRAVLKRHSTLRQEIQDHSVRINNKLCMEYDQRRSTLLIVKQSLALLKLDAHLFEVLYLLDPNCCSNEGSPGHHLFTDGTNENLESTVTSCVTCPSTLGASILHLDPSLWAELPFPDLMTLSLALDRLNSSISHSSNLLKENVPLFIEVNRFGARRLTFFLRMVCIEAIKRGSVHQVWAELKSWLEGLNRDTCLSFGSKRGSNACYISQSATQ